MIQKVKPFRYTIESLKMFEANQVRTYVCLLNNYRSTIQGGLLVIWLQVFQCTLTHQRLRI